MIKLYGIILYVTKRRAVAIYNKTCIKNTLYIYYSGSKKLTTEGGYTLQCSRHIGYEEKQTILK